MNSQAETGPAEIDQKIAYPTATLSVDACPEARNERLVPLLKSKRSHLM
jgi:hypothetical protein